MSVVKIKDRDNLVKNLDTGAVINTDTLAYEKRIKIFNDVIITKGCNVSRYSHR